MNGIRSRVTVRHPWASLVLCRDPSENCARSSRPMVALPGMGDAPTVCGRWTYSPLGSRGDRNTGLRRRAWLERPVRLVGWSSVAAEASPEGEV